LIGAPKLQMSSSSMTQGPLPKKRQLDELERVTASYVEWINTVDQVLTFLQQTGGIKLGLGPGSQCVTRMERALIGKCLREGRHHYLSKQLSLPAIRDHLFQSMDDLNYALLCIIESNDGFYRESVISDTVVSIALLRSMRREAVDLISLALDSCLTRHGFLEDQFHQICSLHSNTLEACAYFSSWLQFGMEQTELIEKTENEQGMSLQLLSMNKVLESLRSALMGCHEALNGDSRSGNKDEFKTYWDEVRSALGSANAIADVVECQWMERSSTSDLNLKSNDTEPSSGCIRKSDVGEFTNDQNVAPVLNLTDEDSQRNSSKVLIYTGRGTYMAVSETRAEERRPHDQGEECRTFIRNTESMLMHELKKHLSTLPPAEELPVIVSEDDGVEDDDTEIDVNCDKHIDKREEPCVDFSIHKSDKQAMFFLTELLNAIPKGEQVTGDNYAD